MMIRKTVNLKDEHTSIFRLDRARREPFEGRGETGRTSLPKLNIKYANIKSTDH